MYILSMLDQESFLSVTKYSSLWLCRYQAHKIAGLRMRDTTTTKTIFVDEQNVNTTDFILCANCRCEHVRSWEHSQWHSEGFVLSVRYCWLQSYRYLHSCLFYFCQPKAGPLAQCTSIELWGRWNNWFLNFLPVPVGPFVEVKVK